MKTFEIGKIYTFKFVGDHNLKGRCEILSRTAKTISFLDLEENKVRKAKVMNAGGAEFCYPLGKFSLCPVLRADRAA